MASNKKKTPRVIVYSSLLALIIPTSVLAQNGQWINYTSTNSGMLGTDVQALAIDKSGNVWIGSRQYVDMFDGTKWVSHAIPYIAGGGITIDKNGNVWIAELTNGISQYDGSTWKSFSGAQFYGAFCFTADSAGNLWLANYNRIDSCVLQWFNGSSWTSIPRNLPLTLDSFPAGFLSLYTDPRGNVWAGGSDAGGAVLFKFDGATWTVFNSSNSGLPGSYGGIAFGGSGQITMDKQGVLWLGSWDNGFEHAGGLVKFDGSQWRTWSTSNSNIPSDNVYCVAVDDSGNKWIGTINGLAKFDSKNWEVWDTTNSPLRSDEICDIVIDRHNNKWIANRQGGVYVFNEDGITAVNTRSLTASLPHGYSLSQNFPNPFNPTTSISYDVSRPSYVRIDVYDVLGRQVNTLVDETKVPGSYHVTFDATNLPSGVYYYRLQAGAFTETKKLMIIK